MADALDQRPPGEAALCGALARDAEELTSPAEAEAFAVPFGRFGGARVVLLGEATHGTAEFYQARAAITRRLVERHGFTIVALEADWPDAAQLDAQLRDRASPPADGPAFARFPRWMWRNAEMRDFAGWLRRHNSRRLPAERVALRGLDIYSLGSSIEAVLAHLDAQDPEAARAARRRYGCLTPWQDEPADYGRAVLSGAREACEEAVVAQCRELLARRLQPCADDDEALFDAQQNARVVTAAERYYRAMWRSGTESWNLRDRHMFETLRILLDRGGPDAKAVVWAHNSHVGNAAATEMGWGGQFTLGELCRTAFGTDAALIGFGTDRGTVACASDWGGEVEFKTVRPALPGSHEAACRDAGLTRALLDLRRPELAHALQGARLERAIGVIYRPETERRSHWFEAVLPDQFDAFVWFAETHAVTPLDAAGAPGAADTFPFGPQQGASTMPDNKDETARREQAEASQRLQDIGTGVRPAAESGGATTLGSEEASPGASGGQRLSGAGGIASGVQRGGTKPGGGPGAGLGSVGTGGASNGRAATGNVKRGGS